MTEQRPPIPLAVFQQLRDRPQVSSENWLGRRILQHYGIVTADRRRIRKELLTAIPWVQRDDWQIARLVLARARSLWGAVDPENPTPELLALRETESVKAEEWYRDVILASPGQPPHLLVRMRNERALAVWVCFSNRPLASVRAPCWLQPGRNQETVIVLQELGVYLGPAGDHERLMNNLFGDRPTGMPKVTDVLAADEDEDQEYDS
jgi:hypothetical protein